MKVLIRNTAGKVLLKALSATWAATLPLDASAQPSPAEIEELVEYAQCIRDNGYPEFPDPGPEGLQFRLAPGTAAQFEAAQRACVATLPGSMAAMNAPPTPEVLEAMLQFAACVRASGVPDFPDPSPQGVFEVSRELDMRAPAAQRALEECRKSHPSGGLRLLLGG